MYFTWTYGAMLSLPYNSMHGMVPGRSLLLLSLFGGCGLQAVCGVE